MDGYNCIVGLLLICIFLVIKELYRYYKINTGRTHLHTYLDNLRSSTDQYEVVFLISHDYDAVPNYGKYCINIIQTYCDIHNYKLVIRNHYPNNSVSPYWLRVYDLLELTKSYQDDTIFVYVDLDTAINPKYSKIKITDLLDSIDRTDKQMYSIYIGRDSATSEIVNTGVIFIRNNNISRSIIFEWLSQYNSLAWSKKDNKWVCTIDPDHQCEWAKANYEQGEFSKLYKENDYIQDNVKVLHTSVCSTSVTYLDAFIYHFMGLKKISNFKSIRDRIKSI